VDRSAGRLNGVLWVLRTGAPWHDLLSRYPPYQTCHRRFQLWQRSGRLDRLLQRLAEDLRDRPEIGPTRRGKSSKVMAICDRGYDSDGLDDLLMTQYGIEMIAANRRGRAKTQDGRPLRRGKRRWKIERLFAWLRVVTRWERHVGNYLDMVQLACARILLRAFMR
jgi:transposase